MNRDDDAADSHFAMLLTIAALSMALATVLLAHAVLRAHAALWQRPVDTQPAAIAVLAVFAGTLALERTGAARGVRLAFTAVAFATAVVTDLFVARSLRLDLDIAASSALALVLLNGAFCVLGVCMVAAASRSTTHGGGRTAMYARFLAVTTALTHAVVWLS